MRICCPSTSSSCSQSRPLSGTAAPSRSKPSDNFHLALQRATTARIWVFLCLPKSHSLLGGHIWARKRSGRHEGGAEGLLQHHHPLGALRDLWCRFRFTTLIFLLFDQGGEAFPTVPGFLTRSWIPHPGQERREQQAGAEPGSSPSPCRGIRAQSRACRSASSSQRHSRNAKKQAPLFHLEPPSSPRRFLGFFWRFLGFFWEVFCLRTCSSGSADGARGGQMHLRVLQEDSKCTRRVPRG